MPRLPACLLLLSTLAFAPAARAAESPSPVVAEPTCTAANPRYTGSPFITTWTAEDYGAAPINWHIVFNPVNGFVYVGNNYGVLEFDGAAWRLIELPDHGAVQALAVDARGRVWAGSTSELCLLTPDDTGVLHAVSLRDRLPPAERTVGTVLFAVAASDGCFFATVSQLYFFGDGGTARTWPAQPRIYGLWWMDGALHVAMTSEVFRLRAGALERVAITAPPTDATAPTRKRAYTAAPDGTGGWLLLSALGPSRWAGPGSALVPLSEESLALTRAEQITTAAFLTDGRIAYGTIRNGLLVFDRAGHLVQRITRDHGLPGNRIEKISEDAEGGLWIATHTGVARVQLDSPFAVHGLAQGVTGSPRALERLGNRLYLTHSEGVAWRGPDGVFHDIAGLRIGTNKLFAHDGRMFATGPSLHELPPDGDAVRLLRRPFSPLLSWPREPARLLAGGLDGLSLLTLLPDGTVRDDGLVKGSPLGIRDLLDGGDGWVWGVTSDACVWRVDFRGGLEPAAPIEVFDEARGLPPVRHRDNAKLFRLDGQIVAASAAWIRRFDAATGRFVPETRLANPELATGATGAVTDADGDLWLRSPPPAQTLFRLPAVSNSLPPWNTTPLFSTPLAALVANDLYHDAALRTLWLTGQGALISMDLDWKPARAVPPLRAFVRRVATAAGESVFVVPPSGGSLTKAPSEGGTTNNVASLTPRQNSLRFDFAAPAYAPDYRGKLLTVYRTRLEGFDTDWTPWSAEAHRDFTQLPYRAFTFHVEARSLDGRTSAPEAAESTLAFIIAPPWWLTRWAFASYVLFAGLGVVGFVKLRVRGLNRRAAWLENEIAAHTVELHARNQELARLHQLELDEKTSAKIGEQRALIAEEQARLEMLRYQLNPHFLFNALASISGLAVARPTAARDMIGKLSEFCRLSLARGRDDTATLAAEFEMLRLYLDVEKARWEDGLQTDFRLDDAVRDVRLPSFLLLPLVENAVKYGSQTSPDILGISVSARRGASGRLEIEVANTGTWVTDGATTAQSTHIGLANLRERLARAFPGRHVFTTESADGWVRVRLTISSIENPKSKIENA